MPKKKKESKLKITVLRKLDCGTLYVTLHSTTNGEWGTGGGVKVIMIKRKARTNVCKDSLQWEFSVTQLPMGEGGGQGRGG